MTSSDPYQRPERSPVMYQRWRHLLFLQWEIDPKILTARLPAGLTLDTFEGKGYLGVVPFYMEKIRPRFLPPVPKLSWFLELNVRTYVRDKHNRPGVWFFSLDCNQPIAVEVARRFFHLPYEHAKMTAKKDKDLIDYSCRRKGKAETSRFIYRGEGPTGIATPGSFEYFLLERYLLFSTNPKGNIFSGQVYHPPYQFSPARIEQFDVHPLEWNDFRLKDAPCSTLYSPGPEVEIYPLSPII